MSMNELRELISIYRNTLARYGVKDSDVFNLAQKDPRWIPVLQMRNAIALNMPSVC